MTTIEGRFLRWISAPSGSVGCDPAEQNGDTQGGGVVEKRCRYSDDETDIGADGEVEVVDSDDAELADGCQGDRARRG